MDASATIPRNWLVPPPTPPTPIASGWTASTDYPSKCIDLGTRDATFTPASTYTPDPRNPSGPPGIYCFTGTNGTLSVQGSLATQVNSAGNADGYTFFALNGSQIVVSSNATTNKFYWPSSCGARPTTRPASFTCFSRTISGYDPQSMFYATNALHARSADCAICISGQNTNLQGDMFATLPATFPPPNPATQTGGTISLSGGANSAGKGFLEAWWLVFNGNNGSYEGTGPSLESHCQFNPPVSNPDQYLNTTPPCTVPAGPPTNGTLVNTVDNPVLDMSE